MEWPTFGLILLCYAIWGIATTLVANVALMPAMLLSVFALALHASLQHEIIHGHPFRNEVVSAGLVFPALGLFIPYLRFRDTHLAHHQDQLLTDPYDDPETNFLDPDVWDTQPGWIQVMLRFNNSLLGRMLVGPIIAQYLFMRGDWQSIRAGQSRVLAGWLLHAVALAPVILWLWQVSLMPAWAYVLSAYMAISVLKIRTFLEHRAHENARGRTVIIEDRSWLGFIFLNNNLHVVHHMHPKVPWYRLWQLYRCNREKYLALNDGYRFRSYGEVFRAYFLTPKDPVPHPLRRR